MSVDCYAFLVAQPPNNNICHIIDRLNANVDRFKSIPYIDLPDIVRHAEKWIIDMEIPNKSIEYNLNEVGYISLSGPNGLIMHLSDKVILATETTIWKWFLYEKRYSDRFRGSITLICDILDIKEALYVPDCTRSGASFFEFFESGKSYNYILYYALRSLKKIDKLPVVSDNDKMHIDGYFIEITC